MKRQSFWRGSLGLSGFLVVTACAGADEGDGQTGQAVEPCASAGSVPCAPAGQPSVGASGEQGVPPPTSSSASPAGTSPSPGMGVAMNDQGPVTEPMTPVPMTPEEMEVPEPPDVEEPEDMLEEMPVEEPVEEEPVEEEPFEEEPVEEEPVEEEPVEEEPTPVTSDEVPDIEYCADVMAWEPEWSQWEEEVLLLVNERRAEGADCGSQGSFDPAEPLAMDPLLRCTARVHSLDMFERGFFDHDNPDGEGPGDRLDAADYQGSTWGENIAQGYSSPEEVVDGWMDSDGHCSNIMAQNFSLLGVGYHPGEADGMRFARNAHYWTQNFGAPPRMGGGR